MVGPDNAEENSIDFHHILGEDDLNTPLALAAAVQQLWWRWADFHIYIISPSIHSIHPPLIILPETIPHSKEQEFVYPIHDAGNKLSVSKSEEMFTAGMSMCKLSFTIEKIISILIERLRSEGIDTDVEVQIAFGGHLWAQRKAFESVINLSYNVVVTNFDPGSWGENYLQTVKRMADKGYGYPTETPRDNFSRPYSHTSSTGIKR